MFSGLRDRHSLSCIQYIVPLKRRQCTRNCAFIRSCIVLILFGDFTERISPRQIFLNQVLIKATANFEDISH
ncbi:hypothetical protein D3C77_367750 [compost metagenome]